MRQMDPAYYHHITPYYKSVMAQPLHTELHRILNSEAPKQLVSQLQQWNSNECRIQEELIAKSLQISKLQQHIKAEIDGIHKIAEQNASLQQQLESLKEENAGKDC